LLDEAQSHGHPSGISLDLYAVVEDVHHIHDRAVLSQLSGRHVWSEATVEQRFQYRTPGLFVLLVRVYRRPAPIVIADSPHFAGCKSWVDLPSPLSTHGLQPVLDDAKFDRHRSQFQELLAVKHPVP